MLDGDRRSEIVTDSEYSSEQNDEEDQDWINLELCDEEDVSIDEEQLMKESLGNSNSNLKRTEEERESINTEEKNDSRKKMGSGPSKENGPTKDSGPMEIEQIGLGVNREMGRDLSRRGRMENKMKEPNVAIEEEGSVNRELEIRDLGGKRRRQLQECYPEDLAELWPTKIHGESARTKQRGRADFSMGAVSKVKLNGNCSISDGCIENRNRMIQREMTL
ncbi:hypothetical protein SLA2020_150120 [Shorea laevis]